MQTEISLEEAIRAARAGIELWRTIPTYPLYQASNLGRIRNGDTGHVLKPQPINSGATKKYFHVCVRANHSDKAVHKQVSRLIALTWLGPSDLTVDHKDHDKANNRIDNLRYISGLDNIQRAWQSGQCRRGEEHYAAKLSYKHVLAVRLLHDVGMSTGDIGRLLDLARSHVHRIAHRQIWQHVPELDSLAMAEDPQE